MADRKCFVINSLLVFLSYSAANVFWPKSKPMEYNISTPPLVTEPTKADSVKYVSYGGNITLHCRARGNPKPTYRWFQDGQILVSDEIMENNITGDLTIQGFSSKNAGYYQCFASNSNGVSISPLVLLQMRVEHSFSKDSGKGRVEKKRLGEGVALECYNKPTMMPPGTYSWYYSKGMGESNSQIQIQNVERFDMDVNGTFYITRLELQDQQRQYVCAAQTSSEQKVISLASVPYYEIQVEQNNDFNRVKPEVLGHTGHVVADRGGEVILECFFSGNPKPNITWRVGSRNQVIVNGSEAGRFIMSPSAHKLTIRKLEDDDEGNYYCQAVNQMDSISATTYLNVTSRPVFDKSSPQIVIATTGSDATFSCRAKGSLNERPPEDPEWFINGNVVTEGTKKYTFNADRTQLTVHNVTRNDPVSVQCNVSNSRGYEFGNGYLTVIDPLRVTTRPNSTIEIEQGRSWVNLSVRVTTDRCCPAIFAWGLNSQPLTQSSLQEAPYHYSQGHNWATLAIRVDDEDDEEAVKALMGEYRCDVFHTAYAENGTVKVRVKHKLYREPEPEKFQSAEVSLWWIGLVAGLLVLIIAVVLIVLMIRYNYPRQAYLLDKEEKKHRLNPEQDLLDQSFEEI